MASEDAARSKKPPTLGLGSHRTVKVVRGPSGFGLTLHGQSPCTLRNDFLSLSVTLHLLLTESVCGLYNVGRPLFRDVLVLFSPEVMVTNWAAQ